MSLDLVSSLPPLFLNFYSETIMDSLCLFTLSRILCEMPTGGSSMKTSKTQQWKPSKLKDKEAMWIDPASIVVTVEEPATAALKFKSKPKPKLKRKVSSRYERRPC